MDEEGNETGGGDPTGGALDGTGFGAGDSWATPSGGDLAQLGADLASLDNGNSTLTDQLTNDPFGIGKGNVGTYGVPVETLLQALGDIRNGTTNPGTDKTMLMTALESFPGIGSLVHAGDLLSNWATSHGYDVQPSSFTDANSGNDSGNGSGLKPGLGGGVALQGVQNPTAFPLLSHSNNPNFVDYGGTAPPPMNAPTDIIPLDSPNYRATGIGYGGAGIPPHIMPNNLINGDAGLFGPGSLNRPLDELNPGY